MCGELGPRGWRRLAPRTTADRLAAGVVAAVAVVLLTGALCAASRLLAAAWPLPAAAAVLAAVAFAAISSGSGSMPVAAGGSC